jgi:hypothetical protein
MTFFFDAPTMLGSTGIVGPGGLASADFTDAGTGTCFPGTPYAGVSTCTVDVIFTPHQSGASTATVRLLVGSELLASGTVQGVGVVPGS